MNRTEYNYESHHRICSAIRSTVNHVKNNSETKHEKISYKPPLKCLCRYFKLYNYDDKYYINSNI